MSVCKRHNCIQHCSNKIGVRKWPLYFEDMAVKLYSDALGMELDHLFVLIYECLFILQPWKWMR
jgi:hypothetical protein